MTSRHILLVALGSAGDVHPFVGIALRLKQAGHDVTILTNPMFEPLVRAAGIAFLPIGTKEDYLRVIEDPDLWHPFRGFQKVVEFGFLAPLQPVFELIRDHYVPGRTLVAATPLALGARVAQEALGVPLSTIVISPALLRSVYQTPRLPGAWMPAGMPRFLKRGFYRLIDAALVDRLLAGPINAFRAQVGLPQPVTGIMRSWWNSPTQMIAIFPAFYAPPQPDWPPQVRMTSFPLYDGAAVETMPAELAEFLYAGAPPIVFTFGSANRHARAHFDIAAEVCRQLGRRGVLLSRFAENVPPQLPPGVRHFAWAPLSKVLPQAAALVSHGGIGTVAQGLAAGVPQAVIPLAHDQFDNAARLERLGVGRWCAAKRISAARLAGMLRDLLPAVRARAQEHQAQLAAQDGIAEICELIVAPR